MEPQEFTALIAFGIIAGLALFIGCAERAHAANSGACYNIGDADARSYCLARARRDAGTCYTIQRADLRAQCLAEVRQ